MLKQSKPPRRRWLRFSLASLLIVTTVLCIALAVLFNRVRRQRSAVEAFRAAGGKVDYDYSFEFGSGVREPPPGSTWLRPIVGDEMFQRPAFVWLRGERITDALLIEHLGGVWPTEFLSIASPRATDAAMDEVAALRELKTLYINCPEITDAGFQKLNRLKKLTTLSITSQRMTDAAMTDLASLPEVSLLELHCPLLTPAGVRKLQGMGNIASVMSLRDPANKSAATELALECRNEFVNFPTSEAILLLAGHRALRIEIESIPDDRLELPFTFENQGATLSDVLDELLAPLEADYFIENGTLKIVPKEIAQPHRAGYRAFQETFPQCQRIIVDW